MWVPLVGQLEHQQQMSEICFILGGGLCLLMSSAECKEYIWEGWHKEVAGSFSGGSLKAKWVFLIFLTTCAAIR